MIAALPTMSPTFTSSGVGARRKPEVASSMAELGMSFPIVGEAPNACAKPTQGSSRFL